MSNLQIDRRIFSNVDYTLILLTVILAIIGIFAIKAATFHTEGFMKELYFKQLIWVGVGIVAMISVMFIDFRELARFAYFFYFISICLLLYVHFFGKVIYGAQRWIDLGFFSFQVSEFAKIAVILSLAKFFDDDKKEHTLVDLIFPTILMLLVFLLIAKEPDLGTALMLAAGYIVVVTLTAIKRSTLWNIVKVVVILLPFSWFFLHDYQKKRIFTLFDPSLDPLGTGYHTLQAKIAIGSGRIWGTGVGGTQSRLNFLPERHTDFIFAVISESFGIVGATIVLILLMALIIKCFMITATLRDRFSTILCGGLSGLLASYITFNIGMELGLFPVVGIPLPLVSYGGSSIVFTFISIGIIISLKSHRFRVP
ncbi:MAG: rod shape-determining protein RodA [Nitrospinae bacterium]|nr:rod shape-determining protein RodA [Nitrospinota bacterium]